MRKKWHIRTYILAGLLTFAVVGAMLSHTAYAKFQNRVNAHKLDIVFAGVTPPVSELQNGPIFVKLKASGKFLKHKKAHMELTLVKVGSTIMLTDQSDCAGAVGWCISSGDDVWVYSPDVVPRKQLGLGTDTLMFWGEGMLAMLPEEKGRPKGMADYRVMIDQPSTDEEGLRVIVNLDGFAMRGQKVHFEDED